tara:strand:- start:1008 stop:1358 length:351 start_codon:yes stop_codon:yes gene_type:complete
MKKENPLLNFFYVSIGAIPATIIRWQIDEIFIVNILGCFFLGFVNALSISRKYKLIFGFSFCGSLTTFSSWIFNLYELLSNGLYIHFVLDIILIIVFSFFALYLGKMLAQKIKILT